MKERQAAELLIRMRSQHLLVDMSHQVTHGLREVVQIHVGIAISLAKTTMMMTMIIGMSI